MQWNNWVQIIKKIKIKASNHVPPRVPPFSKSSSLSASPATDAPCRRVYCTRSAFTNSNAPRGIRYRLSTYLILSSPLSSSLILNTLLLQGLDKLYKFKTRVWERERGGGDMWFLRNQKRRLLRNGRHLFGKDLCGGNTWEVRMRQT